MNTLSPLTDSNIRGIRMANVILPNFTDNLQFAALPTVSTFQNLTDQRFGRLIVLGFAGYQTSNRARRWYCFCDCGNTIVTNGTSLKAGTTRSCGCLSKEVTSARATHRQSKTSEYFIWNKMRIRCKNPKSDDYHNYGGRGIKVCERWEKFENFIADMGKRPSSGHSIDRVDNEGHYEPNNCRWATQAVQMTHTRRSIMLTYNGQTLSLPLWCQKLRLKYDLVDCRLRRGWSVAEAFNPKLFQPHGRYKK